MATYRLALAGGLELAGQVREWTCEHGRAASFDEEAVAEIALAVSEAVSNVVRHAYEGRTDGRIEATLTVDDTALTLRLRDYGHKFDPSAYQPPDLDTPAEGGYGIFLMRTVMDEVRYDTGHAEGTELILVKKRVSESASQRISESAQRCYECSQVSDFNVRRLPDPGGHLPLRRRGRVELDARAVERAPRIGL